MFESLQDPAKHFAHHRLHHHDAHQRSHGPELRREIHAHGNLGFALAALHQIKLGHGALHRHRYLAQFDPLAAPLLPFDHALDDAVAVIEIALAARPDAVIVFAQLIGRLDERMIARDAAEIGEMAPYFSRRQADAP